MKRILILSAVCEAATGVALLIVPSLVARLLFGEELAGVAISIARVTGIALIALGIACWPGPPLAGMLTYSVVVTLYLAYVGFVSGLTDPELFDLIIEEAAQLEAVKNSTDRIPDSPAAVGSAMTLQTAERDAIATALLDLANTIDGKTLRQAIQIIASVLAGKVSGAGSGTETFRSIDDQHNRVVVTADVNGNRTNVNRHTIVAGDRAARDPNCNFNSGLYMQ
jgi:hypothetical protein